MLFNIYIFFVYKHFFNVYYVNMKKFYFSKVVKYYILMLLNSNFLITKKYDGQLFVLLVLTLFYIMYVPYKYTFHFNNFSFVFYLEFL